MAVEIGTASNFADLFNKLRNFLTTNAALVAAGEAWVQVGGSTDPLTDTDAVTLKGPGTAGTDEILVGIEAQVNVGADRYNLGFSGFTAWNPGFAYRAQVGATHDRMIHLWNVGMPYWFIANGRRFMVVVRVESVYASAYCGLVLPYTLPSVWPYPIGIFANSNQPTWRYSETSINMRGFFDPGTTGGALLFPDSVWRGFANWGAGGSGQALLQTLRNTMPYSFDETPLRTNLDGSYNLEPCSLICADPFAAQLAAMQGVFRVSGFGLSAESIIEHGGVDYLAIPNVFRTTWRDYAAIALE